MSEDRLYQSGQSALDNSRWGDAVEYFNQAALRGGERTDAALYWKAYALRKSGKASEGEAVLAELQSKHAGSRWLDDAKVLALQIKQEGGRPVSPEAETDDEMKIYAINGIMQSDPERGLPLLEGILKGASSPKVKRNALFVLAQSPAPKAQALLEQVARGSANPDLQVKRSSTWRAAACQRRPGAAGNLTLSRMIRCQARDSPRHVSMRDGERLLAAVKNEKDLDLKRIAIESLGNNPGNPELWQLYQSEPTVEGKKLILDHMHNNGDPNKLLEFYLPAILVAGTAGWAAWALARRDAIGPDLQRRVRCAGQRAIRSQKNQQRARR
jgi:hypothetical protein